MSSPTSTGPAGPHFEGKVGAHYLLSMLVEASPRGLPGTTIDRIELQRAPQGMYLDDVIVRAHDLIGGAAVLEIQVKRTITFAPKDQVFRSSVQSAGRNGGVRLPFGPRTGWTETVSGTVRRSSPDGWLCGLRSDRRAEDRSRRLLVACGTIFYRGSAAKSPRSDGDRDCSADR
jgi:hypothetical protein